MLFFLATLPLEVTFAQASFNEFEKALLWTTHTWKDKILKPRVVDFYDNTFGAKMALKQKWKYLNFNY